MVRPAILIAFVAVLSIGYPAESASIAKCTPVYAAPSASTSADVGKSVTPPTGTSSTTTPATTVKANGSSTTASYDIGKTATSTDVGESATPSTSTEVGETGISVDPATFIDIRNREAPSSTGDVKSAPNPLTTSNKTPVSERVTKTLETVKPSSLSRVVRQVTTEKSTSSTPGGEVRPTSSPTLNKFRTRPDTVAKSTTISHHRRFVKPVSPAPPNTGTTSSSITKPDKDNVRPRRETTLEPLSKTTSFSTIKSGVSGMSPTSGGIDKVDTSPFTKESTVEQETAGMLETHTSRDFRETLDEAKKTTTSSMVPKAVTSATTTTTTSIGKVLASTSTEKVIPTSHIARPTTGKPTTTTRNGGIIKTTPSDTVKRSTDAKESTEKTTPAHVMSKLLDSQIRPSSTPNIGAHHIGTDKKTNPSGHVKRTDSSKIGKSNPPATTPVQIVNPTTAISEHKPTVIPVIAESSPPKTTTSANPSETKASSSTSDSTSNIGDTATHHDTNREPVRIVKRSPQTEATQSVDATATEEAQKSTANESSTECQSEILDISDKLITTSNIGKVARTPTTDNPTSISNAGKQFSSTNTGNPTTPHDHITKKIPSVIVKRATQTDVKNPIEATTLTSIQKPITPEDVVEKSATSTDAIIPAPTVSTSPSPGASSVPRKAGGRPDPVSRRKSRRPTTPASAGKHATYGNPPGTTATAPTVSTTSQPASTSDAGDTTELRGIVSPGTNKPDSSSNKKPSLPVTSATKPTTEKRTTSAEQRKPATTSNVHNVRKRRETTSPTSSSGNKGKLKTLSNIEKQTTASTSRVPSSTPTATSTPGPATSKVTGKVETPADSNKQLASSEPSEITTASSNVRQRRADSRTKPETRAPPTGCTPLCTIQYDPVCAGDGANPRQTFSNECELNLHNCRNKQNLKIISHAAC